MKSPINMVLLVVTAICTASIYATNSNETLEKHKLGDYPGTWDWRGRSFVVNPVKNQTDGKSGSWAFAITSAIEAQYGLKYNVLGQFSPQ